MIIPDRPLVLELQENLARKYKTHGTKVEALWQSFDKSQKTTCLIAGAMGGIVLLHAHDKSVGDMVAFSPEINVRDVTNQPNFLLNLLRIRVRYKKTFEDCCHKFSTEDKYAINFNLPTELATALAAHKSNPALREFLPQGTGELVLQRQATVLRCLNVLVEDILTLGAPPMHIAERPPGSDKAATEALSKLSLQAPTVKLELPDMVVSARSQQETLEGYLNFLSLKPEMLARCVNGWFFTRPELPPDEQGRRYTLYADKYISGAVFDAMHCAIKDDAMWKYIERLLDFLESATLDKVHRTVVLQEISNTCHLEYGRAQSLFKHFVQTGTGRKWLRRIADKYDKPETNTVKAVDWIKKLSELHETYPTEREKLAECEAYSLSNLAVIIVFIQDLTSAIRLPSPTSKKGKTQVRSTQKEIDLREFAVPINNVMDPNMKQKGENELALIPRSVPQLQEERVEQRRQKEKTRPSHSSAHELAPELTSSTEDEPTPPSQTFKVGSLTAEVFSTLFDKSQARDSVHWAEFVTAMVDLGFSVLPRYGSIYTFLLPDSRDVKKSLTLHRPHESRTEKYLILMIPRRFKRVYGWGEHTFETI
ncbi:hypothetical protein B0J13DRAFT_583377 [Dactylonectria estremocensis]|uniref:Uncharacterized protein n=1 Tax=Dactylonectria estremocensis TaxID=1079267 RepID=A0A9P9EY62_9HYPO|nr:hypothetical protein B0J13DRAFT_583377 [Dactylonectria estremocensis]